LDRHTRMFDFKPRDFLPSISNHSSCLYENVKRRRLKVTSLIKPPSDVISVRIAASSAAASVVSVSVLLGYKVAALGSWFLMRKLKTAFGRCTVLRSSSRHSHSTVALSRSVYAVQFFVFFFL
jgi:hypothetical protein